MKNITLEQTVLIIKLVKTMLNVQLSEDQVAKELKEFIDSIVNLNHENQRKFNY